MVNGEQRCGLLFLTVNNAGRHFNYHKSPQINFYSRCRRKHVEKREHFQRVISHDGVIFRSFYTHRDTLKQPLRPSYLVGSNTLGITFLFALICAVASAQQVLY